MSKHDTPSSRHIPVLCNEVVQLLAPQPDAVIVDATIGLGGHSAALLARLSTGRLIGLDRDPDSLALAQCRLQAWAGHVIFRHADFATLPAVLKELHLTRVDGLLADLGVSSWQLEQPARGLSFQREGPLDMRMDPTSNARTAADVLRRSSSDTLTDLFRRYGEERHAARIARAIVRERRHHPIRTTQDVAALIARAVPASARQQRLHPATRVFQALRIAVNSELETLQQLLACVPTMLAPSGRVVIISFHSLEDRLVKRAMQGWARAGQARLLTRRPLVATAEERANNPRARSAKLRACLWQGPAPCAS